MASYSEVALDNLVILWQKNCNIAKESPLI